MDKNKVYQAISQISGIEENKIAPEKELYQDLNLSQNEISDLLLKIEQQLNIELPKDNFKKIKTIENILNLVEEASNEIID